ncbi:DUF6401 family natural product biosynthesis protein [Qaidamihabitans albus]|uniref:DUF6401 family natural product biosynthesis protein n=1 Tax=Qaidamihabitans albus TaxID=2795733 RepID=UPI0027DD8C3C|nr:DUF6401 family natural product biosynthesis protein [Qaidamihabitans albus]
MGWLDAATDRSARRWLSRMAEELQAGWAALAAQPSLRGPFDRHRTSVTEEIRAEEAEFERAVPVTRLVLLAGRAYEIRAQALRQGWQPPRTAAAWDHEEWYGLRLLACYDLASREPKGPRPRLSGVSTSHSLWTG